MPPVSKDPAELLALAATQLDKATAATTHLLDKNDAQVQSLAERVAVIEQQMRSVEARLKKIEMTIEGTLDDKGLKERFHYVETEIKRLVDYMGWIDGQFKSDFFKAKEPRFSLPPGVVDNAAIAYTLPIAAVVAVIGFVLWVLLK